jgi:hypothetical protein
MDGNPQNSREEVQWYYRSDDIVYGPMSIATLVHAIERGRLASSDLLRCGATGPWIAATEMIGSLGDTKFKKALPEAPVRPLFAPCNSTINETNHMAKSDIDQRHPSVGMANHYGRSLESADAIIEGTRSAIAFGVTPVLDIGNMVFELLKAFLPWNLGIRALGLIALLLILTISGWGGLSAWRSMTADTEAIIQLNSIYFKFINLRATKASDTTWNEFETRTRSEMKPVVKHLEWTANSSNPRSLDLLWAFRDFLPQMVIDARQHESKSEILFKKHLQRAQRPIETPQNNSSSDTQIVYGILILDVCIVLMGLRIGIPRVLNAFAR